LATSNIPPLPKHLIRISADPDSCLEWCTGADIRRDRVCLVFSGAQVTKGRARAIITSTGMSTEIGKIATALESKAVRKERGFQAFWYKTKVLLGVADTTPLQIKWVFSWRTVDMD